jgi:hypothetical protein
MESNAHRSFSGFRDLQEAAEHLAGQDDAAQTPGESRRPGINPELPDLTQVSAAEWQMAAAKLPGEQVAALWQIREAQVQRKAWLQEQGSVLDEQWPEWRNHRAEIASYMQSRGYPASELGNLGARDILLVKEAMQGGSLAQPDGDSGDEFGGEVSQPRTFKTSRGTFSKHSPHSLEAAADAFMRGGLV